MEIKECYNMICENICFYRKNNLKYGFISQDYLARLSGVNINLIKSIEEKKKELVLNLNIINNIANALEIPIYKFFIKRK